MTKPALNWTDLFYFLNAAQAKTLASAARSMQVEHTTIGRRLSALEQSLGASLVIRGPEGLKLTALGEKVLSLVVEMQRNAESIAELARSQRLRVRLALPTGLMNLVSQGLINFRANHPDLSIETLSGGRLVDLKRGEADMAIRVGESTDEELIVRKLGDIGWALYAARSYIAKRGLPLVANELSGHDLIAYGGELADLPAAQWIEERADNNLIVVRVNEITTMVAAAVAGSGIALLPCFMTDGETSLQRLTPDVLSVRPLSLVYLRDEHSPEPLRLVRHFVIDLMKGREAWLSGQIRPS